MVSMPITIDQLRGFVASSNVHLEDLAFGADGAFWSFEAGDYDGVIANLVIVAWAFMGYTIDLHNWISSLLDYLEDRDPGDIQPMTDQQIYDAWLRAAVSPAPPQEET